MRLSAPELAGRYRDGMVSEGAHVVDAGMVGTEMVYWLVGSRDLDGGLMCTASHNPKAYTGAKMVERGSVALSGDRGLQEIRAHIENGLGAAPGGGSCEEVDIYADFQREALKVIDASAIRPLKVVLDGGNGMAGPMVGPILETLPLELVDDLLGPGRRVPRPRAEPAAAREPRVHHPQGASRPAPTSASPGTATPTAASSSTARASSSPATS